MSVVILPCILFVTNTDDTEYLKLSEVDSAVENFARDASSQCEDSVVSIFMDGVGQVRFVACWSRVLSPCRNLFHPIWSITAKLKYTKQWTNPILKEKSEHFASLLTQSLSSAKAKLTHSSGQSIETAVKENWTKHIHGRFFALRNRK